MDILRANLKTIAEMEIRFALLMGTMTAALFSSDRYGRNPSAHGDTESMRTRGGGEEEQRSSYGGELCTLMRWQETGSY